jgi:hypothetical protein
VKITVDVDCTPEEARAFLGLPDVKPMQEQLMNEVQERMVSSIRSLGPEQLLRTWLPAGFAGFEQLQEYLAKMGRAKRE